jgi:hypothetical protein
MCRLKPPSSIKLNNVQRAARNRFLAQMTAGFAFGQLAEPVVSAALGRITADASFALSYTMLLAATSLIASAMYLSYENRERNRIKEH